MTALVNDEESFSRENAWNFIVARYRELLPHELQQLHGQQDAQGLDIVLHLFREYSALHLGRALSPDEVAAAESQIADWRLEVIQPLRRVRRALKQARVLPPGQEDSVQALRARVARAELDAEQAELFALCDWLSSHVCPRHRTPKNLDDDLKRESRLQYANPTWPWDD